MIQFVIGLLAPARAFVVGLVLVLSVPALAANENNNGPALWVIENGPSTVHLFGSMHLLKPDARWRTARLDDIINNADHLVMEIKLDPEGQAAIQRFMAENGMFPPGQSLKDSLPDDLYKDLINESANLGLPETVINRMRPWYAALVLSMGMIQRLGFDPRQGVEHVIATKAANANIKVSGLETPREQLSTMAGQSPKVQEAMVRDSLRQLHEMGEKLDDLTAAWTKGDTATLEELLIGGFEELPELYEAVLVERNRRWLPRIQALLDEPGRHLVVVGSAHLLGEDSVIAMLRAAGLTVKRE